MSTPSQMLGTYMGHYLAAHSLSARQFAPICGISFSIVSKYIRGEFGPTIASFEKLAAGCRLSPHRLAEEMMDPYSYLEGDSFVMEIASQTRQLTSRDRRTILEVIDGLQHRRTK